MAEEKRQKTVKEPLSKEDISVADSRIKLFLAEHKKLYALQGMPAVISAFATVADKLSRGNDGSFKPGWLYTFLASNVLSGSSVELVEYHVLAKQAQLRMDIQRSLHEEFDSFPIAERQRRNPEAIIADEDAMSNAVNGYLGSKGKFISGVISSSIFLGTTIVSGGLANLPIMGATMAVAGGSCYFINKKLNENKVEKKNQIRKQDQRVKIVSRHLYDNSVAREVADVEKRVYNDYAGEQEKYSKTYRGFTNMLSKYALVGTAIKTAIVGGVVATTWATNPVNVLVTTAAAMGVYSAVTGCVNSYFSLKEHVGNFAHAYKSFKTKLKGVSFGKKKIKENADTIELDRIVVKHRDKDDITEYSSNVLFKSDETLHIGKGITLLSGASGAGKSSLINLMLHSDDVAKGAIRIGSVDKQGKFVGEDYKKLAFGEPAKHIALSLQNGKLSEMTVEEYICLANPKADEKLVSEVKKLVGIEDNPENPACISPNLKINPTGKEISGGQINRLNLAQALIKDSPIMILDEPTAGVDATMSANIVDYINKQRDKKTIVYITHDVNEVKDIQAHQAIDISKDVGNEVATVMRFDLTNPQVKEEYVAFFADRNTGRSGSLGGVDAKAETKSEAPEELINDKVEFHKRLAQHMINKTTKSNEVVVEEPASAKEESSHTNNSIGLGNNMAQGIVR